MAEGQAYLKAKAQAEAGEEAGAGSAGPALRGDNYGPSV